MEKTLYIVRRMRRGGKKKERKAERAINDGAPEILSHVDTLGIRQKHLALCLKEY